jgi:ketosteroid isomerase-like protein
MSQAQLDALRELNAAFVGGGDWIRFYDADAEFEMPPEWPEEPVYRGHDGIRKALQLWRENFDEYRWDEERLIEAEACVVGLYRQRGRIKGAGTWIDQAIGCLWYFDDGKIVRARGFFSWEEAMEAAGVSA